MDDLFDDVFALTPAIRYVALGRGQQVEMRTRPDLSDASSSESDRYEELLVNPTLLTLARQRGELDCGGLRYVVIGYGHFHQLVVPLDDGGHVSVAFERDATPADHLPSLLETLARHRRPARQPSEA